MTDVSNQLEVADAVEQGAGEEPVSTIMSTDVVALEAGAPLRTAAEVMRDQDVGSVVVTDGGHVTGIVTDRDVVIRAAAEGRDLAATTLGSISSSPVLSVDCDVAIADVVRLVRDRAVRRIVVTESGDRPVGVVSLGDLARRRDPGSVLADVTAVLPDSA